MGEIGGRPKGLRVRTTCTSEAELIALFSNYCDESSVFAPTDRMIPKGATCAFSIELADGSPMLRGVGVVLGAWPAADNRFACPGVHIGLGELTTASEPVLERLLAARTGAGALANARARPRHAATRRHFGLPPIDLVNDADEESVVRDVRQAISHDLHSAEETTTTGAPIASIEDKSSKATRREGSLRGPAPPAPRLAQPAPAVSAAPPVPLARIALATLARSATRATPARAVPIAPDTEPPQTAPALGSDVEPSTTSVLGTDVEHSTVPALGPHADPSQLVPVNDHAGPSQRTIARGSDAVLPQHAHPPTVDPEPSQTARALGANPELSQSAWHGPGAEASRCTSPIAADFEPSQTVPPLPPPPALPGVGDSEDSRADARAEAALASATARGSSRRGRVVAVFATGTVLGVVLGFVLSMWLRPASEPPGPRAARMVAAQPAECAAPAMPAVAERADPLPAAVPATAHVTAGTPNPASTARPAAKPVAAKAATKATAKPVAPKRVAGTPVTVKPTASRKTTTKPARTKPRKTTCVSLECI